MKPMEQKNVAGETEENEGAMEGKYDTRRKSEEDKWERRRATNAPICTTQKQSEYMENAKAQPIDGYSGPCGGSRRTGKCSTIVIPKMWCLGHPIFCEIVFICSVELKCEV